MIISYSVLAKQDVCYFAQSELLFVEAGVPEQEFLVLKEGNAIDSDPLLHFGVASPVAPSTIAECLNYFY